MYCAKCGNQTAEGAKFCNSCGAAMPQGTVNEPQGLGSSEQSTKGASLDTGKGSADRKKGNKKLIIIVSSVAAVILIGILVISNLWAISPKTWYGYLESRNNNIKLNDSYKKIMKAADVKPFSKNIGVTVSEVGGLDIGSAILNDFELQVQVDYSKGKSALYASCKYLNNLLADAILYNDKDLLGVGLPTLYDKNFYVRKDEITQAISNFTGSELDIELKTFAEVTDQLDKDTKLLDKAINKYMKIAYKNLPSDCISVTSPDDPIDIYTWQSGRARSAVKLDKYKLVEIKLLEKNMYIIFDKIMMELRNDDELLNRIVDYAQYRNMPAGLFGIASYNMDIDEKADLLEELKSNLDMSRENLEYSFDPEGEQTVATMTIVADSNNQIVSREIVADDSVYAMMNYVNDEKEQIVEFNMSEGRFGTGDQIGNLYVYKGEEGKGVKLSTQYDGMIELTYKQSDKEKNSSGIGYGVYKASIQTGYEEYSLKLTADKEEKGTDLYELSVQQDNQALVACEILVEELKNKSKLKFSKDNGINMATVDENELQEIFGEIEEEFSNMTYDLGSRMFFR